MKITTNSLRIESDLILVENTALLGYGDVICLVNLMRLTHNDIKDTIHVGFHDFPYSSTMLNGVVLAAKI
jgi:hypothetical protein